MDFVHIGLVDLVHIGGLVDFVHIGGVEFGFYQGAKRTVKV